MDGTSCLVRRSLDGNFTLWARYDRKPTKKVDPHWKSYTNKLREYLANGGKEEDAECPRWHWDVEKQFKPLGEHREEWVPADRYDVACRIGIIYVFTRAYIAVLPATKKDVCRMLPGTSRDGFL